MTVKRSHTERLGAFDGVFLLMPQLLSSVMWLVQ